MKKKFGENNLPIFMIDHDIKEQQAVNECGFDFILCKFHVVKLRDEKIAQHLPGATDEEKKEIINAFEKIELCRSKAQAQLLVHQEEKFKEQFSDKRYESLTSAFEASFWTDPWFDICSPYLEKVLEAPITLPKP